jgi:hypothetical protein
MRRWRDRLAADEYSGLGDRRKGKVSFRRVPLATVEEVLRLYREVYHDLNVRHFHEKLGERRAIGLSYTWVQQALQGTVLGRKDESVGSIGGRPPLRSSGFHTSQCLLWPNQAEPALRGTAPGSWERSMKGIIHP